MISSFCLQLVSRQRRTSCAMMPMAKALIPAVTIISASFSRISGVHASAFCLEADLLGDDLVAVVFGFLGVGVLSLPLATLGEGEALKSSESPTYIRQCGFSQRSTGMVAQVPDILYCELDISDEDRFIYVSRQHCTTLPTPHS